MSLWEELKTFCLAFEGAAESFPWDHHDFTVKGKTFVFTSGDKEPLGITAKPFPENREMFLQLPGVRVAAYVGRFGWLSMTIQDAGALDVAKDMIAESYLMISKTRPRQGKTKYGHG